MNSYKSATLKGSGIMNTPVLSSLEYVTNSETRMTASVHKIQTHKRLKITLLIRNKYNMRSFDAIPFNQTTKRHLNNN